MQTLDHPEKSCHNCPVRGHSALCDLPTDLLDILNRGKIVQHFPARSLLYIEGNAPQGLYAIIEGKVKVSRRVDENQSQLMQIAGPGELLGYRSLLFNEPYRATAEVLEDSVACLVDRATFASIMRASPEASLKLMKKTGEDVDHLEARLAGQIYSTVSERLAGTLLLLHKKFGQGESLGVRLSREDLASLCGTTIESAIRVLGDLRSRGLISMLKREIAIKNPAALEKAAGSSISFISA